MSPKARYIYTVEYIYIHLNIYIFHQGRILNPIGSLPYILRKTLSNSELKLISKSSYTVQLNTLYSKYGYISVLNLASNISECMNSNINIMHFLCSYLVMCYIDWHCDISRKESTVSEQIFVQFLLSLMKSLQ